MPRKLAKNYTCYGALNRPSEYLPHGPFVDPYELFETDNPALKKVVEAQKTFRNLTEKEFRRGLPKIMNIVCKHFGIKRQLHSNNKSHFKPALRIHQR